jgi:HlyD family secretion protein
MNSKKSSHHIGRWLVYGGAVLLIALIAIGLQPQPAPVELAKASVGVLRATVSEEGKTRIKQRYMVTAPVTGQLRRIPYKPGAEAITGKTVIAVIDPLTPAMLDERTRAATEARRQTALANVNKAQVAKDYTASELKRVEQLYAQKTTAAQELDAARYQVNTATQELESALGTLRQVEAELAEFAALTSAGPEQKTRPPVEILAPSSGRILHVLEESVRVVSSGTPLVEIGDPADLECVIEVLSRDGAIIAPGTKVELEQWGGNEPLIGKVRLIEPAAFTKISALGVEEQRVNVVVDFVTPLAQRRNLGDNFRVEGRIIIWEASQALKVPTGALFRRGSSWATFVIVDGRAHLRQVQIGRSSGIEAQILEGLKDGEEVILYPGDRIQEGQRVRQVKI